MRSARSTKGAARWPAFTHGRAPAPGSLAERTYKPLLRPGQHKIIGFAQRTQGLIVAPRQSTGLNLAAGRAAPAARVSSTARAAPERGCCWTNCCADAAIAPTHIAGFDHTEPSHAAVAHTVAAGQADVGLGIEVAARRQGLDFIALVNENYHLVCLRSALEKPATQALRAAVAQRRTGSSSCRRWRAISPSHSGEVLALSRLLPWWTFTRRKNENQQNIWSLCGNWKFLKRGFFMRSRVANDAPRSTLWLPKQGSE